MDSYFSPKEQLATDEAKCANCSYFEKLDPQLPKSTFGYCLYRGNYPDEDGAILRTVQDLSVCSAWVKV